LLRYDAQTALGPLEQVRDHRAWTGSSIDQPSRLDHQLARRASLASSRRMADADHDGHDP
jgi:hypothetical protein